MPLRLGDKNESVRQWRHVMNARFGGLYTRLWGPLPEDTNEFGPRAVSWQREYERRTNQLPDGEASDHDLNALGIPIPAATKYPIQGVGADSNAFLNPPTAHSFNKATDQFAAEGHRLHTVMRQNGPAPIIVGGYSMGGVSVKKFLDTVPEAWRSDVKMVYTFGDPSMPASGSLLGDMPGEGISKNPQPQWVWDRYYSFAIDGDWYPQAAGLLFFLYEILTRMELTLEFATWLFTQFPSLAMQQLIGSAPSTDPLAGILSGLGGAITSGPSNSIGSLLGPLQILTLLPQLVNLLVNAIRFAATQAHGMYDDPGHALWDGMTGVNKAVQLVRQVVPGGGTMLLFPGTWSQWNQLFQFDVALRLQ